MIDYIALISEDEDRIYHVMFPDFPTCKTASSTIAGAKRKARDVLAGHVKIMKADGAVIPLPSKWEEITNDVSGHEMLAIEVSISSAFCNI